MSRGIKFRAWSNEHNRYCDFVTLDENGRWIGWIRSSGVYLTTADIILEQYTGLKDKNGVEICEGDIVKCYSQDAYPIGRVMYSEEYAEYEIVAYDTDSLRVYSLEHFSPIINKYLEVIGNIHENQELLEGC